MSRFFMVHCVEQGK